MREITTKEQAEDFVAVLGVPEETLLLEALLGSLCFPLILKAADAAGYTVEAQ